LAATILSNVYFGQLADYVRLFVIFVVVGFCGVSNCSCCVRFSLWLTAAAV